MSKTEKFDVVRDAAGNRLVKRPNGTLGCYLDNFGKSRTQQCFSDMTNVNIIMKKWQGRPPPLPSDVKQVFADVSHGMDFQQSLERVNAVQEAFDRLPADTRSRFRNNPVELLDFVGDPANEQECIKLGLMDAVEAVSASTEKVAGSPEQSST